MALLRARPGHHPQRGPYHARAHAGTAPDPRVEPRAPRRARHHDQRARRSRHHELQRAAIALLPWWIGDFPALHVEAVVDLDLDLRLLVAVGDAAPHHAIGRP